MATTTPMEWTDERMIPELYTGAGYWEHLFRYRFAAGLVKGRRVLDIACGEGYGSAGLMRAEARSVIGVDISADACEHARRKYGIDARVGDAQKIPVETGSVDAVVSFETIEHVPDPQAFLVECKRVCRPGGYVIISTPNKEVYREQTPDNHYHCSEMTAEEFRVAMGGKFKRLRHFVQTPTHAASLLWPTAANRPWYRYRGGYWFYQRLAKAMGWRIDGSGAEPVGLVGVDAREVIASKAGVVEWLVNPYAVRSQPGFDCRPMYLVCVGET